jgi:hypothetical protein
VLRVLRFCGGWTWLAGNAPRPSVSSSSVGMEASRMVVWSAVLGKSVKVR